MKLIFFHKKSLVVGSLRLIKQLYSHLGPRILLYFCFAFFSMGLPSSRSQYGCWHSIHHHFRQDRRRRARGKGDTSQLTSPFEDLPLYIIGHL